MGLLDGKKVLITGARKGIGRGIAITLAKEGADIGLNDIVDDEVSAKCVDIVSKNGVNATFHKGDVSKLDEISSVFDSFLESHKKIDVLINNAGVSGSSAKLEDCDFLDWKNTLDINLNGTFLSTKLAIPLLKNKGGSIINMGSTSSFLGNPLRSAYSASKWGLIGLTKTWAMEYGKNKIRVNTICPCSVNGERIDCLLYTSDAADE